MINGDYILVSDPGVYTVVVTDEFGCTSSSSVEVLNVENPEPTIMGDPTVCDDDDGQKQGWPAVISP